MPLMKVLKKILFFSANLDQFLEKLKSCFDRLNAKL